MELYCSVPALVPDVLKKQLTKIPQVLIKLLMNSLPTKNGFSGYVTKKSAKKYPKKLAKMKPISRFSGFN